MAYKKRTNVFSNIDSRVIRLRVTFEEKALIERTALRYGLSQNAYIQECLDSKEVKLSALPRETNLSASVGYRLPLATIDRAQRMARTHGARTLASYIRARAMGGLSRKPPRLAGLVTADPRFKERMKAMGIGVRRGRPRHDDYLVASVMAAGGDLMQAIFLDPSAMKRFVHDVFDLLSEAGLKAGDLNTLYKLLKSIIRIQERRIPTGPMSSNPNVVQGSEVKTTFLVWSPLHGVIEIEEPPPAARAAGAAKRVLGSAEKTLFVGGFDRRWEGHNEEGSQQGSEEAKKEGSEESSGQS